MIDLSLLPVPVIVDTMPKPQDLPNGTYYGTFSCKLPNGEVRIPYHHKRDFENAVSTETGFTRAFLKSLPLKRYKRLDRELADDSRTPLYVRPAVIRDAAYVDIVGAYPSLYKLAGWDVEYRRDKWLGFSPPLLYPFPAAWKIGRSFVITGARPHFSTMRIYGGEIKMSRTYNPRTNPVLINFVYDTLNAIGRLAQAACRAVYWNVDGGIMPMRAVSAFSDILSTMGLSARVKYFGKAEVLSSGHWSIGDHQTQAWLSHKLSTMRRLDNNALTVRQSDYLIEQIIRANAVPR